MIKIKSYSCDNYLDKQRPAKMRHITLWYYSGYSKLFIIYDIIFLCTVVVPYLYLMWEMTDLFED